MHLSIKDRLLPQPPSFCKRANYEIHGVLGEGAFGKVMVSLLSEAALIDGNAHHAMFTSASDLACSRRLA